MRVGGHVWIVGLLLLLQAGLGEARQSPAQRPLLDTLWQQYRQTYITRDGRVVDRRLDRVTSEGQSYGLLRAVWMADADAFAKIYHWTETHLRRPDGLYGWLWQPARQGRLRDANTATDADQDIALALILASRRFDEPAYLRRATLLVKAIRRHAGIAVGTDWFISAGNWARSERIVNLSYFSPAAYPYFQRLDPDGGWDAVRRLGFRLVDRTLALPGVRLLPDFCRVTPQGAIRLLPDGARHSNAFSFDAMRYYWRLALDCRLHGPGAMCDQDAGFQALLKLFRRDGGLFQAYTIAGRPMSGHTSVSFYGALLPLLEIRSPALAAQLRSGPLSRPQLQKIADQADRYYDLNWTWLGLALSDGWIASQTPAPSAFPIHPAAKTH
ncbi:MAG: glycosyl hydrolase family 8 [Desulfosarcinaceae bacterium]|nr:glycosyl hydrolase family 8 [Desulfosarcinaceae bacterium]